jgi:transcriptional regulator with AAA-type ATPase domain
MKLTPPPPVVLVTRARGHPDVQAGAERRGVRLHREAAGPRYFRAAGQPPPSGRRCRRQNEVLQAQLIDGGGFEGIIGKSPPMQTVVQTARQVAARDIPVLIIGESGTARNSIARAIHNNSPRRKSGSSRSTARGCRKAIPRGRALRPRQRRLHRRPADREGRFEHADGGTLFHGRDRRHARGHAGKLLRVLENGEVVRLGRTSRSRSTCG